ncbi:hypothetical protein, partial [Variovorax sp. dw_308]|uniref:hypothetical protein n=1 Tax=Variovorax sp. dw_308 TaxID=2721546 RepID=UPI001C441111
MKQEEAKQDAERSTVGSIYREVHALRSLGNNGEIGWHCDDQGANDWDAKGNDLFHCAMLSSSCADMTC